MFWVFFFFFISHGHNTNPQCCSLCIKASGIDLADVLLNVCAWTGLWYQKIFCEGFKFSKQYTFHSNGWTIEKHIQSCTNGWNPGLHLHWLQNLLFSPSPVPMWAIGAIVVVVLALVGCMGFCIYRKCFNNGKKPKKARERKAGRGRKKKDKDGEEGGDEKKVRRDEVDAASLVLLKYSRL